MKKCIDFRWMVLPFLMALVPVPAVSQDNVIDEVVWVVGDEAILKSDTGVLLMVILIVSYLRKSPFRNSFCIKRNWIVLWFQKVKW